MNHRKLYHCLIPVLLLSALPALAQSTGYTGIYTFDQYVEGCCAMQPALLAQGTDGNLYGTLRQGGTSDAGSWLQYNMSGLPLLTNFGGNGVNAKTNTGLGDSESGFTLGLDGNFYGGVSNTGGISLGAIIKLSSAGGAPTVVYNFPGGAWGTFPKAPPIQGIDMNLYGVTSDYAGVGYVYQVLVSASTGAGAHGWIYQLPSGSTAPLIVGSDGNYYGTYSNGSFSTSSSGALVANPGGYGGIFQITPAGVFGWYYNLNPFSANNNSNGDGSNPIGAVMQAADGYLYGTAAGGGTNATAGGVVFRIALNGAGYTVIHNFQPAEGTTPHSGLVQGSDGFLYGLATKGGPTPPPCSQSPIKLVTAGTLFKISTVVGSIPTVPIPFCAAPQYDNLGPGMDPESTLTLHTNGLLYGLTFKGGFSSNGASGSSPGAFDDAGEFFSLNAGLKPFVSVVGRRSANVGDRVGIIGQGFLNATGVTFGGVAAGNNFKWVVVNDHYMTAAVPIGAQTGLITVTETTGTLSTLYNFTINCNSIFCRPRF